MSGTAQFWLARAAWLIPAALLALSIHQFGVAGDLAQTLERGTPAVAEVLRYERSDRKDVTQAELDLRVTLPDGSVYESEHLALPYSIAHRVESDSVDVMVDPEADLPIVLTAIAATQRRIALSNGGMSLIAFLMAFAGVFAWNRYLRRTSTTG